MTTTPTNPPEETRQPMATLRSTLRRTWRRITADGRRTLGWLYGWIADKTASPVGLASALTGIAACLAIIWGGGEVTVDTVERGAVVGFLSGFPVFMLERNIRRRNDREREAEAALATTPELAATPDPLSAPLSAVPSGPATTFRGRRAELDALLESHREQRAIRASGGVSAEAAGAIVLMVHGMPGVGKSALAEQLRRELEPEYGSTRAIYANLGIAGGRRPPAEILRAFLDELGRPVADPAATVRQLADQFRSLTFDKQLLFVFDAARDHDQVRQILPTGPGCTVIVTSRRDLSPALNKPASLLLDVPSTDDALDILSAWSLVTVESDPEAATELVDLCGRLPFAIVAAAERIAVHGTDLRHVADTLRPTSTRLEMLEHIGRNVAQRFTSELDQLTPELRRALCLLTLVPAPTFLARALTSLLAVRDQEAEDLMAGLAEAQLVVNVGIDEAVEMPRYSLNSIVRLVCQAELSDVDEESVRSAERRFIDAYVPIVADIVKRTDGFDGAEMAPHRSWVATGHSGRYSDHVEYAVRLEYPTLVWAATEAHARQHWGLCWRITARLRGGVPEAAASALPLSRLAIEAARRDGNQLGEIAIWLAKAAHHVALEVYGEAFKCIASAHDLALAIIKADPEPDLLASALAAYVRAYGMYAETYVHMGAFERAAQFTEHTARLARRYGVEEEAGHIALLRADTHRVTIPMPTGKALAGLHGDDQMEYRRALIQSEDGRRRRDWTTAESCLARALQLSENDAPRTANVNYRLARLALDQSLLTLAADDGGPADARAHAHRAIRRAALAAVAFGRLGNEVGLVRAQCALVRAHAAAANLAEAEHLLHTIAAKLPFMRHLAGLGFPPLAARYAHAEGDLLAARGHAERAWSAYMAAASLYAAEHDWSGRRAVMHRLNDRGSHRPTSHGESLAWVDRYLRQLTGKGTAHFPTPRHHYASEDGLPGSSRGTFRMSSRPRDPVPDRADGEG